MKSLKNRLLPFGLLLAPVLAQAHPGHDGDHEFVWDFEHFASHPLATILCSVVIVAAGWATWRLLKSSRANRPVNSAVTKKPR